MHQFEHFLDRLGTIDGHYDDIVEHLQFWFAHNGYIKNHAQDAAQPYTFRHFTMEASAFKKNPKYSGYRNSAQNSYEVTSEWIDIGDLSGITKEHAANFNFVNSAFTMKTHPVTALPKFAQSRLLFTSRGSAPSFKIKMLSNVPLTQEDRLLVQFEFVCDYNEDPGLAKKTMAGISVIDRDWYKYVDVLRNWWTTTKAQITKQG